MNRSVLVVNGHPDPRPERFCAALCDAYERGARAAGNATRRLDVGALQLSALVLAEAPGSEPLDAMELAFRLVRAADQLAIFYPLWAGAPPPELHQLFDMVARLNAHLHPEPAGDKTANVVVTSGLPALFYRGRPDTRPALRGVAAGEPLLIGSVDTISPRLRTRWLEQMQGRGEKLS
ncbi:MAG: NAD(P)H-dependent oxidoreductase [Rhizomicrobium sp.]